MLPRLPRLERIVQLGGVLLHRVIQSRHVAGEPLVDRLRAKPLHRVPTEIGVVDLRGLDRVVAGNENIHRIRPILARGVEQIGRQRFVWLLRHILRGAHPQVVLGDRRDVAQCLAVPLRLIESRLGDDCPGRSAAAAFRHITGKAGDRRRPARQRVDMLVRRDALCRIDRQGMSESEQQAARGFVSNATPFHLGDPAILGAKAYAGQTLAEHCPRRRRCCRFPASCRRRRPQVRRNSRSLSPAAMARS